MNNGKVAGSSRKLRSLAYGLSFVLCALPFSLPSSASVITVNIQRDLSQLRYTAGGWGTYPLSIAEVHPVAGDTVRFVLDFVDATTGTPQRLEVSDLGIGAPEEVINPCMWGPDTSINSVLVSRVTFHDVLGDLPSNPVSNSVISGGGGVCGSTITAVTDSTFSFSGLTQEFIFSSLTYHSGDGFDIFELTMEVDSYRNCTFPGGGSTAGCFPGPGPFPAPEPGTLALLGLGLAGLMTLRRSRG